MKVAYNACFGGFGLSPLAQTEYAKKKGINLTWYQGIGHYPYQSHRKIKCPVDESSVSVFALSASTIDLGDEIAEIDPEYFYYKSWHSDEDRADPDLIEVIERLGENANGMCAKLAIKEIPDDAQFEITEYDGMEDVVPPRMEW